MRSQLSREEAERLVQTYSDLILRLSFTYLKNTEDAKDICQTVFLRLLEKPREFQSPEHERAWIICLCQSGAKKFCEVPKSIENTRFFSIWDFQKCEQADQ